MRKHTKNHKEHKVHTKHSSRAHRIVSIIVPVVSILLISWIASTLNNYSKPNAHAANPVTPPTSIASDCSSDVTNQLNAWLASLPNNSTVDLPTNGCYVVSSTDNDTVLILQNKSGITINGNGTTFKQTSYTSGVQPILSLSRDVNSNVNNLTLLGPNSGGGEFDEGDAGIMLRQDSNTLFDGITIKYVDGDGFDLYAYNGNDPGVNWNTTMTNSTLTNIGYHAIVPEYVDGFTFENSTIANGDVDAEVDFNCDPINNPFHLVLSDCGTLANPSVGVVNMTFNNDNFPNGFILLQGLSCMPIGNWTVENNNFGTGGMELEFGTTFGNTTEEMNTCGRPSGLTVINNTQADSQLHPCCGSGSPYFILQGWNNVNFSNNHLTYNTSFENGNAPIIDMCGDTNVSIENNTFMYSVVLQNSDTQGGPECGGVTDSPPWPASTNVVFCGNTYGFGNYNGTNVPAIHQPACVGAPPPAPATPTGLKVTSKTTSAVSLSWTAATDAGGPGIGGYNILRNGVSLANVASNVTTYTDISAHAGTTYSYTVKAYDKSSPVEFSAASSSVSVTTLTSSGSSGSGSTGSSGSGSSSSSKTGSATKSTGTKASGGTSSSGTSGSSQTPEPASTTPEPSGNLPVVGNVPIVSSAIADTQKSLKQLNSTEPGRITTVTVIIFIALGSAFASLMIWKKHWDPIERVEIWLHLRHQSKLATNVVVGGVNTPTTPQPPSSNQTYKPGETIKPKQ